MNYGGMADMTKDNLVLQLKWFVSEWYSVIIWPRTILYYSWNDLFPNDIVLSVRVLTNFILEGEVTSLSESSQAEVERQQRKKWEDF